MTGGTTGKVKILHEIPRFQLISSRGIVTFPVVISVSYRVRSAFVNVTYYFSFILYYYTYVKFFLNLFILLYIFLFTL